MDHNSDPMMTIDNVKVTYAFDSGIQLTAGSVAGNYVALTDENGWQNVQITNNTVDHCDYGGVVWPDCESAGVPVSLDECISLDQTHDLIVSGNTITNCHKESLSIGAYVSDAKIFDNVIVGPEDDTERSTGILVGTSWGPSHDIMIYNNRIYNFDDFNPVR